MSSRNRRPEHVPSKHRSPQFGQLISVGRIFNSAIDEFMCSRNAGRFNCKYVLCTCVVICAAQCVKIIGIGLPKTGTSSLEDALQKLGYSTLHGNDCVRHGSACKLLYEQLGVTIPHVFHRNNHGPPDVSTPTKDFLRRILRNGAVNATLDSPWNMFYQELMHFFPRAKVILTIRNSSDEWYTSSVRYMHWRRLVQGDSGWWQNSCPGTLFGQTPFGCDICARRDEAMQTSCVDMYDWHIRSVKRNVMPHRLLIFNIADGWKPLCEFLGRPVPMVPFPHVNEWTKAKSEQLEHLVRLQWLRRIVWILSISLFCLCVWRVCSRRRRSKKASGYAKKDT